MKVNNFFYLFVVAALLILSAFSFYWFDSPRSGEAEYNSRNNPFVSGVGEVYKGFVAVISFLDILSNDARDKEPRAWWNNNFNNPIERSAEIASTFKASSTDNFKKDIKKINKSAGDIIAEKKINESNWYKDSINWIAKRGFYSFKKETALELGWQSPHGKTFSISIPY